MLSERYNLGENKGRTEILLLLLQQKFTFVPEHYKQKIAEASPEEIREWVQRVLTCSLLEEATSEWGSHNP